jgi:hypothetical protein
MDFKSVGGRKFLLAVAVIALKVLRPETPDEVLLLAGSFIGAEGVADAVERGSRAAKEGREAVQAAKDVLNQH